METTDTPSGIGISRLKNCNIFVHLNDCNDPYFVERNFFITDRTLVAKFQYALHN